jgi:type I restriction enzyme S subunit
MNDDLPVGWKLTTLSEICEINPPKPRANALPTNAPVTFVPMPAVDGELGAITTPATRPFGSIRNGYTAFREGDVIMAKITPCMENGKAAIARHLENGLGFGSTEFHVFRPREGILPEFIYYYIRQETFRRAAESRMTGSVGQKRVPVDFLEEAEIPLAPVDEQRRIVARLEELQPRVRGVQERLRSVRTTLKRFRQAILAAACSGRLTEDWRERSTSTSKQSVRNGDTDLPEIPESWRWIKLPETGKMSRGKSRHRPRNEPALFGGSHPFIQTGDIAQSGGTISSHKQTYSEAGLAQSRLWPAGTICITIAANIAESAILTYPACFPDSVVGINVNPNVCVAEYIEYFIRVAKANLAMFAPATAQKNINIAILNELSVPLPPLEEQKEMVRRMGTLFTLADQTEARCTQIEARVNKLTEAILARAFRGELFFMEIQRAARTR